MGSGGLLAIRGIQIIWCRLGEVTKTFASVSRPAVVEVPLLHMGDRPNRMLGSLTLAESLQQSQLRLWKQHR